MSRPITDQGAPGGRQGLHSFPRGDGVARPDQVPAAKRQEGVAAKEAINRGSQSRLTDLRSFQR